MVAEKILEEEKNISKKILQNLKIINGESDRLTRLENNILDYSKIEKGIKEYHFKKVSLNEILE